MGFHSILGLASVASVLLMSVSLPAHAQSPANSDRSPVADQLKRIGERRIFFGHQSVGANILDGIRDLAKEYGVRLDIQEADRIALADGPSLVEAYIGKNTAPASKIADFSRTLDAGWAEKSDVAFFKLCYVDFDTRTNVSEIFSQYVQTHEQIKARHPNLTIIHVTVPLTETQGRIKTFIKHLAGRPAAGELENIVRHQFNELLRQKYLGKEPFFDLARLEATFEDGRTDAFQWQGQTYPRLIDAYSDDGGHLNARGRQHVARALIELLATLP